MDVQSNKCGFSLLLKGNLSIRRFKGDGDVSAVNEPVWVRGRRLSHQNTKLSKEAFLRRQLFPKPASKVQEILCECLFVKQERCCY